ncbi:MAG: nucleoside 2-deoxyribosyltransferase [Bacteroidales bacterium]|nr:nucleoside 2-deoxyribosyltransferase [Bacteroidales bacterium]
MKVFVIQEFNEDNDKRYQSVIKPAIEAAGFKPYRVDKDKHVQIPIADIEKKIKESAACIADISDDNLNVCYEVGYAAALEKPLILICAERKKTVSYPFDIRHRHVFSYTANTASGHKELKKEITERLKAVGE